MNVARAVPSWRSRRAGLSAWISAAKRASGKAERHPFHMPYSLGLKKDGSIPAIRTELTCQGGAYNNKARYLNWRAAIHTAGAYRIPNIHADVNGKYTNTIYGGAYRGFSGPQVLFGIETLIDEAAARQGRNPKDFRLQNGLRLGDTVACGQLFEDGVIAAPLAEMIRETSKGAISTRSGDPGRKKTGTPGI